MAVSYHTHKFQIPVASKVETGEVSISNKVVVPSSLGTAAVANIGTDVQAYNTNLAAISGLTSAANKGIQFTGSGTAATYDLTAAGKALLDDADAAAQRATLGLGTAATADSTAFATASQGTLAGSALQRASISTAFIFLTDYGVTLDGTVDDTSRVNQAFAFAQSSGLGIIIPAGKIRCDGVLNASGFLNLIGLGSEVSEFILGPSSGLNYVGGVPSIDAETTTLRLSGIGFRSNSTSTTLNMLKADFSERAGATFGNVYIDDVLFAGVKDGDGFGRALWLNDARNVRISNLIIRGSSTAFNSGEAIYLDGNGSPVETFIEKTSVYFCNKAIFMGGASEGLYVTQSALIGNNYGIDADTIGVKPLIVVSNSHMNNVVRNIRTNDIVQFDFHDCLLYSWPSATSSASIEINVNDTSVGLTSKIHDNIIIGTAQTSGSKQGVLINGVTGVGKYSIDINDNILVGFDTGIWLTENVNGVREWGNRFISCSTNVLDQGSGNIIAKYVVHSGRVVSWVDPTGLEHKSGTVAVTLDSSGNGSIPYPTPFKNNTRTAIVCNGDGFTQGGASFSAFVALANATGLPFCVRPNPGAVNVTVSYVAVGD